MKLAERDIYFKLIRLPDNEEGGYGLCNICRYALWSGCCDDADLECHCGIEKVEENSCDVWSGSDCWAFRPRWTLEDITDMVGIMLQGKHPDMSPCKDLMPERVYKS